MLHVELDLDTPIPLTQLPPVVEAEYGRRVTRQTLWNWARKGLTIPGGHAKLRTLERGRCLYTTRRWLHWFMTEG